MRTKRINVAAIALIGLASFPIHCPADCPADVDGNGVVNVADLLDMIGAWGPCAGCPEDIDGNGVVNTADLLLLIGGWGGCPTGACCLADGSCIIITEAQCPFASQGAYAGDGVACAAVVCPIRPVNDECWGAVTVTNGATVWNNTFAYTDEPPVMAPCALLGSASRDVWFNYTATCTGRVTFDTLGTPAPFLDTVIQVFNGTGCNPLGALLGCNDDIAPPGMLLSSVTVVLAQGQTVKIRCMSWGIAPANSGPAVLNIACVPLDSDLCADAAVAPPLPLPSMIDDTLSDSTVDAAPMCAGVTPGVGRWYTVTGTGGLLTASTCDSPIELWFGALSVYTGGACGALMCVTASDAVTCGPVGVPGTGNHETLTWPSVAGVKYWILVHSDVPPIAPDGNFVLKVF